MTRRNEKTKPAVAAPRQTAWWAGWVIVAAALAVYADSFTGAFVLDDRDAIVNNSSIHHLWPVWRIFVAGMDCTADGRPLVNASLALNWAVGAEAVWSYHAVNLLIHILGGLALLGLVRRTLLQPAVRERFGAAALPLALAVALLWTVHPLQTQAVTYIVQRAESLMALFYLLTLYCFVRAEQSPSPRRWHGLAIAACWLGMASKEVMVSAPVILLLYDRAFVAGGFREAWRRHRKVYLGLAASWILLAALVISTGGNRSGSYGTATGMTESGYLLCQARAVIHYLSLAGWPHPLIFDYGSDIIRHPLTVLPAVCADLVLIALTLFALWRKPALGFLGGWFFAILAPTSVIPAIRQMLAEQRMYLALAPVLILAVLAMHRWLGKRTLAVCLALAAGLGGLTVRRNQDYRTELSIWRDTVVKCPGNAWAHQAMANALQDGNRLEEAVAEFDQTVKLNPSFAEAYNNLGVSLLALGRRQEALRAFELAVKLKAPYSPAHFNLGCLLADFGRSDEAAQQLRETLRLKPDHVSALYKLAELDARAGAAGEAERLDRRALRFQPDFTPARFSLALLLVREDRPTEALKQFQLAAKFAPDIPEAHYNLGKALVDAGRPAEAVGEYEQAVRLKPDYVPAHVNLGLTLETLGRWTEALSQLETAVALDPNYPGAQAGLSRLRWRMNPLTPGSKP